MSEVLYEDRDLVVLDKPAGISVHPSETEPQAPSLVDEILKRWPGVEGVGEDALRPGIVHRLDKETSGILVIAKNQTSFEYLKKQFKERNVEKTYRALVVGKMKERTGEIALPIGRSRKFGKFTARRGMRGKIREAVTKWKVFREYQDSTGETLTLLEVKPETGRTHQIRVHLAAIGHPVAGDNLYGGEAAKKYRVQLGRHFLHAESLRFALPGGESICVEADLPPELQRFLDSMRVAGG